MDRRRPRIIVLLSALVVASLALGACSSGDGDEAATGFSTTTTAPDGGSSTTTTGPDAEGAGGAEGCEGGTPVWAAKATQDPRDDTPAIQDPDDDQTTSTDVDPDDQGGDDDPAGGGDEECEEGPVLGEGELQITLRWEGDADYDLHVIEPDGTEIDYTNRGPTDSGGRLDVDSNIGCVDNGSVENVYWEDGQMPDGHYEVKVVGFSVDGCEGGEYELTVKVRGEEVLNETGTVGHGEEDVYEFDAD